MRVFDFTASQSRRLVCGTAAAACLAVVLAACGSDLTGMALVQDQQPGVPQGWAAFVGETNFEGGIQDLSAHGGKFAAYLHGLGTASTGGFIQKIDASTYRGKRIKITAWAMESFISNSGSFAAEVDAPGSQVVGAVSIPAPAGGTDNWHQVFVVVDVPSNAIGLTLSTGLAGSGQIFFDDVAVTVVDSTVPTTTFTPIRPLADSTTLVSLYAGANATLTNGDFESGIIPQG